MHRHCARTHVHRTGFPVKFLQLYGTLVPVTIFAHQAKERLPKILMNLLGDHIYLHMYSFNIKGFLITH